MTHPFDVRKFDRPFDQNRTLVAVIELSQTSWLVGGMVPGLKRSPLKKLKPGNEQLFKLLVRWRDEAVEAGHEIMRIAVACECGRDGFWLVRWLTAQGNEAYVIHAASVAVSREHRRAKTDRLDTELLKRAFLGWLRGEVGHCSMVTIPSFEEEDAKRPSRERETLVKERTRLINAMKSDLTRLGICNFNPKLPTAREKLETLRTPEGALIPPNTLAKLLRDMERLRLLLWRRSRPSRRRVWNGLKDHRQTSRTPWSSCFPGSSESESRRRTCWYGRFCRAICAIGAPWRVTPVSRAHRMKAAPSAARRGSPRRATRGCAAA